MKASNKASEAEARRRASALVVQALQECRNLMNELYPRVLGEFGLVATIREELAAFRQSTECQTTFHADDRVELSPDTELTLYRVFHEALTNIRKHSPGARGVSVSLEQQRGSVMLVIKDDGAGFDVKAALREQHLGGLMTMRRRVEMARGSFDITSGPSLGTTVTATVPSTTSGVEGHEGPRRDQAPASGSDKLQRAW